MVMRNAALSFVGWVAAVQAVDGPPRLSEIGHVLAIAVQLTALTMAVYRLGRWHQAMEHTRTDVTVAVKRIAAEMSERLDRADQRLDGTDHVITMIADARVKDARWRSRIERRVIRLEEEAWK